MVSAADIPPGGEGKIKVTVTTTGRQGKLVKPVMVYSNDPETPRFKLSVEGEIEVLAGFQPPRIYLREVKKGATVTEVAKLVGTQADKVKLSQVTSSDPRRLKVRLIRQDGRPALKLTFKAGKLKESYFRGMVTARTNLDQVKELKLPFTARFPQSGASRSSRLNRRIRPGMPASPVRPVKPIRPIKLGKPVKGD